MALGWPWPILWQGQHRAPMHLNGENCQNVIWREKLYGNGQMDWIFMILNIKVPQGQVCPHPGAIYIYITVIFKDLLLWYCLANQSQTLYGAFLGRENESLYEWSRSHDQGGRHGYKWQKPLKIFFYRTWRPMILKLGMKHQGEKFYKVYINHDLGMTLTYFMARLT